MKIPAEFFFILRKYFQLHPIKNNPFLCEEGIDKFGEEKELIKIRGGGINKNKKVEELINIRRKRN